MTTTETVNQAAADHNVTQRTVSERLRTTGGAFTDLKLLGVSEGSLIGLEKQMEAKALPEMSDKTRSRVRGLAGGVTTFASKEIIPLPPRHDAAGAFYSYGVPAEFNPQEKGQARKFGWLGNEFWNNEVILPTIAAIKAVSPFAEEWAFRPLEIEIGYIGYRVAPEHKAEATPPFPHLDKIDGQSVSAVVLLKRDNIKGAGNFLVSPDYVKVPLEDIPADAVLGVQTLKTPGECFIFHETRPRFPAHHVEPMYSACGKRPGFRSIMTFDIRPLYRGES